MLSRRRFIQTSMAAGAFTTLPFSSLGTVDTNFPFDPENPLIPAPRDPSTWPEFRRRLTAWREQKHRDLNYSDARYRPPEFAWASRCFSCCFLMLCDESFYDPTHNVYAVKAFLEHGRREFGGYDTVVLWQAYPRIGFDERNQFDFYRDQPGGLAGLRKLVQTLQSRGVKVFVDYNPWDTGTRREGKSDLDALVDIIREIGADGVFLDTMDQGAVEFRAKLDAARRGVVLESEGALPLERIADHHLSWAQWFGDCEAPGVLRNKWFERRHLQHQIKRWDRDHTSELHTAWMNGSGMMVWENVFGTWVGWSARDRSILRAMLPIQRRFADVFAGESWTPLVPTAQPDVYASEWAGDNMRLWTLVNRSENSVTGDLLRVKASGAKFFDLIAGQELNPPQSDGHAVLSGRIPARGVGCFVAIRASAAQGANWRALLASQCALNQRADWNTRFPERAAKLVKPRDIRKRSTVPEGMVEVPAARFTMAVEFRVRECGFYESSDERGFAGSDLNQTRQLTREVGLHRFAIDETPVTNGQFLQFLKASRYRPRHPENFLRHWTQGVLPSGLEEHPVVFVDITDARAYARWAGKRLPTEEEWQYAAEGPEHRRYPWGDELRANVCNDGRTKNTTTVKSFPEGRSFFGCYDLCGNVWHWTESERSDGRTRFCILKGGSWFKAQGSIWYADGGPLPGRFAAKFLLSWPGLNRCATIGFRCVVDLDESQADRHAR
ncbi:MAG: SUMF1/EgtB/PvdO family nonheme iron enzyme [Verrucomicrobiota bacterium]